MTRSLQNSRYHQLPSTRTFPLAQKPPVETSRAEFTKESPKKERFHADKYHFKQSLLNQSHIPVVRFSNISSTVGLLQTPQNHVSPLASFFKPAHPEDAGRQRRCCRAAAGSAQWAAGRTGRTCRGRPGAVVAERLPADGDVALQRQTGPRKQVGILLSLPVLVNTRRAACL